MPLLKNRTPLVVAQLINNAGIVGAALAASEAGRAAPVGASPRHADPGAGLTLRRRELR